MPVCATCGRTSDSGGNRIVRTARQLSSRVAGAAATLTYGEFHDHVYFVCSACQKRDKTVRPAAYIAIISAALVLLIVLVAQVASPFVVMGALVAAAGLGLAVTSFSLKERLDRLAVRERGGSALDTTYIALKPGDTGHR